MFLPPEQICFRQSVGVGADDVEVEADDEGKRKEVINTSINGAIVESIPGNKLTAEELDPETK